MGRGGAYAAKSPTNENFEREVVPARQNHREITIRNFGAGIKNLKLKNQRLK